MQLSLQAVPPGIDIAAVRQFLLVRLGVTQVHGLHMWPLSTRDTVLSAYVVRSGGANNAFLQELQATLQA